MESESSHGPFSLWTRPFNSFAPAAHSLLKITQNKVPAWLETIFICSERAAKVFFVFMASLEFFCFGLSRDATLTCQDIFLKPKMLSCVFLLPHNTFPFTLWPVSPGVFSFTGTAVQTRTPWQHPEAKQTAYFTTLRYCRCRSFLPCFLASLLSSILPSFLPAFAKK